MKEVWNTDELRKYLIEVLETAKKRPDGFMDYGLWFPVLRTKIEDDLDYWNDVIRIVDMVGWLAKKEFGCEIRDVTPVDVGVGSYTVSAHLICPDGWYSVGFDVDYDDEKKEWVITAFDALRF
jgi:hypothetical protein